MATGMQYTRDVLDVTERDSRAKESNRIAKTLLKKNKEKYDLVLISHVLEHTHKPAELLAECRDLIKDKGLIFCKLPDERGVSASLKKICVRFGL